MYMIVSVAAKNSRQTYGQINGRAICEGGNRCAVLRDGSEIQFGKKDGGIRTFCSTAPDMYEMH